MNAPAKKRLESLVQRLCDLAEELPPLRDARKYAEMRLLAQQIQEAAAALRNEVDRLK